MSAVQLLLRPSPWVETFLLYFYCFTIVLFLYSDCTIIVLRLYYDCIMIVIIIIIIPIEAKLDFLGL